MRRRRKSTTRTRRRSVFRRRRGTSSIGGGSLWGLAGKVIPTVAFLEQLTGKARASGKYNNLSMIDKAKTLANNITGNMFGFNIMSGVPTFTQQINPSAIANKYTGIGVGSIIGSMVLKKAGIKVPGAQRALSIGKKMLIPGIIGGFFDDKPTNSYVQTSVSSGAGGNYAFQPNWSSLQ